MESSKDRKDQRDLALQSVFRVPCNQNNQNLQQLQTQAASNQAETKQNAVNTKNPSGLNEESKTKKNPMAAYKSPQSSITITKAQETQKARTLNVETKVALPQTIKNEQSLGIKEKSTPIISSNASQKIEESKQAWNIKSTETKDLIRETRISESDVKLIRENNFFVKKSTKNPSNSIQSPQIKALANPQNIPIKKSEDKPEGSEDSQHSLINEMRRIFSNESKESKDNNPIIKETKVQTLSSLQTKEEVKTSSGTIKSGTGNRLYSSEIIQSKDQEIKQSNSFQAPLQNQIPANQRPAQIVPPKIPCKDMERSSVSNPPPQAEAMHFFPKASQIGPPNHDIVSNNRIIAQSSNSQFQPILPSNPNSQPNQPKEKNIPIMPFLENLKSPPYPPQIPSQKPTNQSNFTVSPFLTASNQLPTNQGNSSASCQLPIQNFTNQINLSSSNPQQELKKQSITQNNLSNPCPSPAPKQQVVNQSNASNQYPSSSLKQPVNTSNLPNPHYFSAPSQQPLSQSNIPNPYVKLDSNQQPLYRMNLPELYPASDPKQQQLNRSNINGELYNNHLSPALKQQPINQNNLKSEPYSRPNNPGNSNNSPPPYVNPFLTNSGISKLSVPNAVPSPYQLANNYSQQTQENKAEISDLYRRSNDFENQRLEAPRQQIQIPPAPQNYPLYDSQMSPYEDQRYTSYPFLPIKPKWSANYEELFDEVLDFKFADKALDAADPAEIPSIFNSPEDYEKWFKPAFKEEFHEFLMRAYREIDKAKYFKSRLEIKPDHGRIRNSVYEESLQNHEILIIIPESQKHFSQRQYLESKNFYKIGIINKLPPPRGCIIIWKNGLSLEPYKEENFKLITLDKMLSASREFLAFQFLPSCRLLHYILYPTPAIKEELSDDLRAYLGSIEREFNEFQFNAIYEILQVSEGVSLLQGPPGTGKTKTIVGILSGFLTKIKMRKFPNILLCAPSNIAIDEIGLRILRKGLHIQCQDPDGIFIIRIGKRNLWEEKDSDYEEPDEIKSIRLEFLVEQKLKELGKRDTKKDIERVNKEIKDLKGLSISDGEEIEIAAYIEQLKCQLVPLKNQLTDYNRTKKAVRDDILRRANVILTTLSGAGSEMLKNKIIDYVIIDEACQSTELSSLIPFQYNPQHVVLIGDPNQLPATMLSEKSEKNKFCRSLFERLATNGAEYSFLSTQYRMSQEICNFPSVNFYNGRLTCAPEFFERRPIPEWINPRGIMFFDLMYSEERKEDNESSSYNLNEAAFIEEIYRYIKKRFQSNDVEIGVISPYTKQVEIIKRQLTRFHQKEWEKHIEVKTIDGFQGREKDVIILSLVRTEGIGFLWNPKRINVSLTRSKFGLWVIGKADCLMLDKTWGAFIEHCKDQQKFMTCFDFNEVSHYFSKENSSYI